MNWYHYHSGEKHGPVSSAELKELADEGIITPETLVETDQGRRAKACSVQGLFRKVEPEVVSVVNTPQSPATNFPPSPPVVKNPQAEPKDKEDSFPSWFFCDSVGESGPYAFHVVKEMIREQRMPLDTKLKTPDGRTVFVRDLPRMKFSLEGHVLEYPPLKSGFRLGWKGWVCCLAVVCVLAVVGYNKYDCWAEQRSLELLCDEWTEARNACEAETSQLTRDITKWTEIALHDAPGVNIHDVKKTIEEAEQQKREIEDHYRERTKSIQKRILQQLAIMGKKGYFEEALVILLSHEWW